MDLSEYNKIKSKIKKLEALRDFSEICPAIGDEVFIVDRDGGWFSEVWFDSSVLRDRLRWGDVFFDEETALRESARRSSH